jgi:N-methylhydantoinase A
VICPSAAGVMSAFGLLASPLGFELVCSRREALAALTPERLDEELDGLGREAAAVLRGAGLAESEIRTAWRLDMRYAGQGYEVEVVLPDKVEHSALPALFGKAYEGVFGVSFDDRPIEIVNWKAEALGPEPGGGIYRLKPNGAGAGRLKGTRPAYIPESGRHIDCPVYDRYALPPETRIEGPALIEERESTCVLGPGDVAVVDRRLNLVIDIAGAA